MNKGILIPLSWPETSIQVGHDDLFFLRFISNRVEVEKKINAALYIFTAGNDISNFKVNTLDQESSGINFTLAASF